MHYDFNYVEENKEALTSSINRRFLTPPVNNPVDRLIELNIEIKKARQEVDSLRHKRNVTSLEFSKKKRDSKATKIDMGEQQTGRNLMKEIKAKEEEIAAKEDEASNLFLWLPNLIDKGAPDGRDDSENVELRRVGVVKKKDFQIKAHIDLGEERGLIDVTSAARVSGSRFYYLKGKLVQLALALEMYSIAKIAAKGYTPTMPPFMLKKEIYGGIAHLATFQDALYKVTGIEDTGEEERFLISTTEHPMIATFFDKILDEKELPIKLVGLSPAFRREAGSHGKDTKGIFRIHQFDQTEQIVLCKPEDSKKFHEEMLQNVEEIWKELGVPYRVVNVCTGDMGVRDIKQYDIEAYLDGQGKYREVGSFDDTTDWIARRLNIKYTDATGIRHYVNTLDGTGLPIQRTIIAIMEHYQEKDGTIIVPEALRKYTGFDKI